MLRTIIPFVVCGIVFGLAFLFPSTGYSLVLGWLAIFSFVSCSRMPQSRPRHFFLVGFIGQLIAFYWIPDTVMYFGGFGRPLSLVIFLGFLILAALQFGLVGWMFMQLRRTALARCHSALAFAWLSAEVLYPRMFPWALSHTQLQWQSFAALTEFVGVLPLGALMIWWAEVIFSFFSGTVRVTVRTHWAMFLVFLLSLLLIPLGAARNIKVKEQLEHAPIVKMGLIQGNLAAKQKGNVRYFESNLARYQNLSQAAEADGASLILWPESVFTQFTPERIENVNKTRFDPFPGRSVPLLYGSLSVREASRDNFQQDLPFNSVFGLDTDGKVVGKYHKRILMPLGEYIPLADRFPWLKQLSPQTGELAVGDITTPIEVSGLRNERELNPTTARVGALICYEDLVPQLAIDALLTNANVLVNFTNDAWYGDTAAPLQHHLLATWRALETRRYLVRVTNTGLTAVVNPFGETIAQLGLFTPGYLVENVSLLDGVTFYAKSGDRPWQVISFLVLALGILTRMKKQQPGD